MNLKLSLLLCLICLSTGFSKKKPEKAGPMNNKRLHEMIYNIDKLAEGKDGFWSLTYEKFKIQVLTDERADRMRIIIAIISANDLSKEDLTRTMQANFDSALDARYSIARKVLWSTYIHPLSLLTEKEFVSGFAQVVTLSATYGTTYTSGALTFSGGDSKGLQENYYDDIMKKGFF